MKKILKQYKSILKACYESWLGMLAVTNIVAMWGIIELLFFNDRGLLNLTEFILFCCLVLLGVVIAFHIIFIIINVTYLTIVEHIEKRRV